jgi:hypothetical protein
MHEQTSRHKTEGKIQFEIAVNKIIFVIHCAVRLMTSVVAALIVEHHLHTERAQSLNGLSFLGGGWWWGTAVCHTTNPRHPQRRFDDFTFHLQSNCPNVWCLTSTSKRMS